MSNRCRSPWIASLEKRESASSSHTLYKQRSWCRPASFEATEYHVQHKVCLHVEVGALQVDGGLRQLPPVLQASMPEYHGCSSAEQRECARGHCVGLGICHAWQRGGAVHVGSQSSYQNLVTRRHGIWENEGGNVLVACTLVEMRQALRRRKPQRWSVPCCQGTQCWVV